MAFLRRNQFKIILAMLIFTIVSVFIINTSLFDEQLKPEVSKIVNVPPSLLDHNNAYVLLYGIKAASDRDIFGAGQKLIERYRQNIADNGKSALYPNDYAEILADSDIDRLWMTRYERCVARKESGCLIQLSNQLRDYPADDARLTEMLERYDHIITLPNFAEMKDTSLDTPLPSYDAMLRLGNIKLVQNFNRGNRAGFLEQLQLSIKFWRNVLEKSDLLITKMVATAALWSNVKYAAEFIANQRPTEVEAEQLQIILAPLSSSSRDISESFDAELRCMRNWGLHQSALTSDYGYGVFDSAIGLLYQPNATVNDFYDIFVAPMSCLSELNASELAEEISLRRTTGTAAQCQKVADSSLSHSPASLYNLGGKILLANAFISPVDYIGRVHDLNGMFNLARLRLLLSLNENENVRELVATSSIRHPYEDKPMQFSSDEKTLSFDCLDPHSSCKIQL